METGDFMRYIHITSKEITRHKQLPWKQENSSKIQNQEDSLHLNKSQKNCPAIS